MQITELKENPDNPRQVSSENFARLVKSVVEFPEMLSLRPIVADGNGIVIGGNMRLRALKSILADFAPAEKIINKLPADRRAKIEAYWTAWTKNPDIPVISAESLTPDQRREFIIKDNLPFGDWDWDILANEWDASELQAWGLDVWDAANTLDGDYGESEPADKPATSETNEGRDKVVTITYHPGQEAAVAEWIGVGTGRVAYVYTFDEIEKTRR